MALISAQAMRVYEMIADMMLFARPPRPELQAVELIKLVDQLVADLTPRCARQDTAICRAGVAEPIVVRADPVQLNVALRAICQNAVENLANGGHIQIEVEPPAASGEVRISISDDGPGIKPEERRHIFDPFYSARQAGRGLGLGLSKAWRIITNHGGRIEVSSQPGPGVSFQVILPHGI